MTLSFAAKAGVLLVFFGSVLFVHLRRCVAAALRRPGGVHRLQ